MKPFTTEEAQPHIHHLTRLYVACIKDDSQEAEALLSSPEIDVNVTDDCGRT